MDNHQLGRGSMLVLVSTESRYTAEGKSVEIQSGPGSTTWGTEEPLPHCQEGETREEMGSEERR